MESLVSSDTALSSSLSIALFCIMVSSFLMMKPTSAMATAEYPQRTAFGSKVTIEIDDNSFPSEKEIKKMDEWLPGCQHSYFESKSNNAKLHYRYFVPDGPPKGVAVFFHGINSHSGRGFVVDNRKLSFTLFSDQFLKQGVALYMLDMYGHGFSEGHRFLVKNWQYNRQDCIDFANFVAEQYSKPKKIPLFVGGESYGGCLAIHTAKHFQDNADSPAGKVFDSVFLSAPAIHADLPKFPVYQILRYIVAPLIPTKRPFFMPHPISPDRIWRDQRAKEWFMGHEYKKHGLCDGGEKLKLGAALGCVLAIENVCNEVIPNFSSPFCIIHGTDDDGVPFSGSEFMMKTATTPDEDKELHPMEGTRHDILTDPRAEEAMECWVNFIKRRLEKHD